MTKTTTAAAPDPAILSTVARFQIPAPEGSPRYDASLASGPVDVALAFEVADSQARGRMAYRLLVTMQGRTRRARTVHTAPQALQAMAFWRGKGWV